MICLEKLESRFNEFFKHTTKKDFMEWIRKTKIKHVKDAKPKPNESYEYMANLLRLAEVYSRTKGGRDVEIGYLETLSASAKAYINMIS